MSRASRSGSFVGYVAASRLFRRKRLWVWPVIAIYDYGRTPEGVFYYAMEYLDGINLDELVRRFGAKPEGRVMCDSRPSNDA